MKRNVLFTIRATFREGLTPVEAGEVASRGHSHRCLLSAVKSTKNNRVEIGKKRILK